jgi:hypothetical protein
VGAPGDKGHVVPTFGKSGTYDAADASSSKNDEPHGRIVSRK